MFNFTMQRDKLLHALTKIIQACEKGNPDSRMVTLSHFFSIRFDGYEDSITMSAGNATRRVEYLFRKERDYTGSAGVCFGVPGEYFFDIIKAFPSGPLNIVVRDTGCTITTPTSQITLVIFREDQLPVLEGRPEREWSSIDLSAFFGTLSKILYCIGSPDHPQPFTRSICIFPDIMVCTNGLTMSLVPNLFLPERESYMIPAESLSCFATTFRKHVGAGAVFSNENRFHLATGTTHVMTALYSGKVPNFHSFIPSGPNTSCEVSKEEFVSSLRRVAVITKEKLADGPPTTQFEFREGELLVTFSGRGNMAKEHIAASYTGMTCKVFMNVNHVVQAAKHIDGDKILIELRGEQFPVVLTNHQGEHKNVIQPIRR